MGKFLQVKNNWYFTPKKIGRLTNLSYLGFRVNRGDGLNSQGTMFRITIKVEQVKPFLWQ